MSNLASCSIAELEKSWKVVSGMEISRPRERQLQGLYPGMEEEVFHPQEPRRGRECFRPRTRHDARYSTAL